MQKRAGLLTFHRARNIGTNLQAFALQEYLNSLGVKAEFIDYRPKYIEQDFGVFIRPLYEQAKTSLVSLAKFWLKTIVKLPFNMKREYTFKQFRERYLSVSEEKFLTREEVLNSHLNYDYYFFGSDQIWNPDLTDGLDLTFFGDFVKGRGKKISYAASIGKNILTECELKKMVQAIEYLDVVGVREVSAANLLQNNTEKDIYVNIDPTLLIDSKAWRRFITKRIRNDKYVFVYALEKNMNLINAAKQIAKRKNLNVVFLDMKNYYGKRGRSYYSAGPVEFLNLLYYADCVVTNSFHGTVFSMIFEKKFFSIPHKSRSTRVIDLLSELGLSDRVVFEYSGKENIDSPIDYKRVNELLSIKRKKSEKYFSDNLDIETR